MSQAGTGLETGGIRDFSSLEGLEDPGTEEGCATICQQISGAVEVRLRALVEI
jgi:hypothetical protein